MPDWWEGDDQVISPLGSQVDLLMDVEILDNTTLTQVLLEKKFNAYKARTESLTSKKTCAVESFWERANIEGASLNVQNKAFE